MLLILFKLIEFMELFSLYCLVRVQSADYVYWRYYASLCVAVDIYVNVLTVLTHVLFQLMVVTGAVVFRVLYSCSKYCVLKKVLLCSCAFFIFCIVLLYACYCVYLLCCVSLRLQLLVVMRVIVFVMCFSCSYDSLYCTYVTVFIGFLCLFMRVVFHVLCVL